MNNQNETPKRAGEGAKEYNNAADTVALHDAGVNVLLIEQVAT